MNIGNVRRNLNELEKQTIKLKKLTGEFTERNDFTYEELELIKRIFKSVKKNIKDSEDLWLANSILEKVNWVT